VFLVEFRAWCGAEEVHVMDAGVTTRSSWEEHVGALHCHAALNLSQSRFYCVRVSH